MIISLYSVETRPVLNFPFDISFQTVALCLDAYDLAPFKIHRKSFPSYLRNQQIISIGSEHKDTEHLHIRLHTNCIYGEEFLLFSFVGKTSDRISGCERVKFTLPLFASCIRTRITINYSQIFIMFSSSDFLVYYQSTEISNRF